MIWIATAATFGLVVCLVVYFFGSRIPRPSVMERIGGGGVSAADERQAFYEGVVEPHARLIFNRTFPVEAGKSYDFAVSPMPFFNDES